MSFRLRAIARSGLLTILNFHQVNDWSPSAVRPADFDALLSWLKKEYAFLTFGELRDYRGKKQPLVLSFDDGYSDFIDIAAPILQKHGIRANQNVVPLCADSGRPPMNVQLGEFIFHAAAPLLRETRLPGLPNGADPDFRARDALRCSSIFKNLPIEEQRRIFDLIAPKIMDVSGACFIKMMSREQIHHISDMGHEVGAHSVEHASMSSESKEYLISDAHNCRVWIQAVTGKVPEVYAFPNGAAVHGQAKIVHDQGYKYVLMVGETFSRTDDWCCSRFTMHGKDLRELKFRALGSLGNLRPAQI